VSDAKDQTEAERQARYTWDFSEVIISQCAYCVRLSTTAEYASGEAFHGTIPEPVLMNRHDHRTPWIDPATGQRGDTGARGDHSLLFEPKPTVPRVVLDRLYKVLDKAPI